MEGIAFIALVALITVACMCYSIGTEMRARKKGWKAKDCRSDPNRVNLYRWRPDVKDWVFLGSVHKVRLLPNEIGVKYYRAGCFTGRYEEAIARLDSRDRFPEEREWYLNQLRVASLS